MLTETETAEVTPMNITAEIKKVLSLATDQQLFEYQRNALAYIRRGEATESTRRVYAVCTHLIRQRGL